MAIPRWTTQDLDRVVAEHTHVLVDVRADWCTRCGPQEQVLERLLPQYGDRVAIGSVDVGEHPEVADEYAVQGLPAFLLFKGGEYAGMREGFRRAPELRTILGDLLRTPDDDDERGGHENGQA